MHSSRLSRRPWATKVATWVWPGWDMPQKSTWQAWEQGWMPWNILERIQMMKIYWWYMKYNVYVYIYICIICVILCNYILYIYDNIWRYEVLDDWQISSTRLRWQSPADVNLGLSQPRRNGDFDTCLRLSAANATIPWLIPFSIKRYCKLQPEFKRKDAPHLRSVLTYPRMLGSTTEITHLIGDRGNSHQFAHSRPSETPARQLGECTELGSSIDDADGCGWSWGCLHCLFQIFWNGGTSKSSVPHLWILLMSCEADH